MPDTDFDVWANFLFFCVEIFCECVFAKIGLFNFNNLLVLPLKEYQTPICSLKVGGIVFKLSRECIMIPVTRMPHICMK